MLHFLRLTICLAALGSVIWPAVALAQDDAAATPTATPEASAFSIVAEPQDDPAITEQGFFIFELEPGDEATGSLRLENTGAGPVTMELAAADAETAGAGGSAYAGVEAMPAAAGAWVLLDEPRVTLGPGEQTSVGFAVEPPPGTAPGQFLAGIIAYIPAAPEGTPVAIGATQAGASIIMQTRYVIPVQVNVPGEWTPSLTITGASALEYPSGTQLGIAMRNNGDTFLQPEGSVTLSNAAATPILEQPIQLGTFITGTDITYPVAWPGAPQGGEYAVAVELNYAEDKVASYRGLLTVSEDAPVAPPAPGEAPQPAVAPVPVPAPTQLPIPMWIIYAIGALLALIAILLILVLVRLFRGGGRRSSDW